MFKCLTEINTNKLTELILQKPKMGLAVSIQILKPKAKLKKVYFCTA